MQDKSFDTVLEKFASIQFVEDFDMIVAVANGGIIPAALLNQRLNIEINLIKIHFRDNNQKPVSEKPELVEKINFDFKGRKILLVEDRVKTGASLQYAKSLLTGAKLIKTFAVNGAADYSLFNEACFRFPWIIPQRIEVGFLNRDI